MSSDADESKALLSFFLGPVQPFIAGAKTTRDLWTGSYLLAWLTFAGMKPILKTLGRDALRSPNLDGNPFLWTLERKGEPRQDITTPCIPNRFVASVPPGVNPHNLARDCEEACRSEWKNICAAVRVKIGEKIEKNEQSFVVKIKDSPVNLLAQPWDRFWCEQVRSFFEVRTTVLYPDLLTKELRGQLLDPVPAANDEAAMNVLFGLMDARKSVRHVPDYRPDGDVPQKCTLLGTYEQMGPAPLDESRGFWETFAANISIDGSRVRKGERLCAISLVKRFAWPAYLREELGVKDVRELHYSDTATVAAKLWLRPDDKKQAPGLDYDAIRARHRGDWSGQWIHWREPDQDKDDPCPPAIWREIEPILVEKRRRQRNPPTYYAILMADADNLGNTIAAKGVAVSKALTRFALEVVPSLVESKQYGGELIYSGGDDTLGLLPTETAVACARALQNAYAENWRKHFGDGEVATLSAGLVIVHHKEDLRFALDVARGAERSAKHFGRDALALAVCRRSGEHTSAVVGWEQADDLQALVQSFLTDVSDRWTYKLRLLLPTFEAMPWESFTAELGRMLERVEFPNRAAREVFKGQVTAFARRYRTENEKAPRKRPPEKPRDAYVMADFVTLCQSASFLARGRDA